jgi:glutathione S-transferase
MTLTLFGAAGTCSLSPHIALVESGLPFESHLMDLRTGKLRDGRDYRGDINDKGYVPALQLADGQLLTEGQVIVQYIADLVPGKHLAPPAGSLARYRLNEWLAFTSSELQKTLTPLLLKDTTDAVREQSRTKGLDRLGWVEKRLGDRPFVLGDRFTVADGYLFAIARWARVVGLDITHLPKLSAFLDRMTARPAVQTAMRADGLL